MYLDHAREVTLDTIEYIAGYVLKDDREGNMEPEMPRENLLETIKNMDLEDNTWRNSTSLIDLKVVHDKIEKDFKYSFKDLSESECETVTKAF